MQKSLNKPHKLFFETLGNEARWDIVHLLLRKHYRATDIARELGYEQSLVSHHLKRLQTCGFVRVEAQGNERVYYLNEKTIRPLLKLVDKHINEFCKKICTT
ncbi:MAG: hypothetical protein B7X04_03670 [Parcubacteria group bacterium 21-54-25]|nr:MAG: hypothetical protein B7X04_03670 [Parcubacteria group bacterium 21-54-25]HQU08283.1 metalloregulator ArsR/SmtB family transcription factor [Candidatus Paceibacterota bacterium]